MHSLKPLNKFSLFISSHSLLIVHCQHDLVWIYPNHAFTFYSFRRESWLLLLFNIYYLQTEIYYARCCGEYGITGAWYLPPGTEKLIKMNTDWLLNSFQHISSEPKLFAKNYVRNWTCCGKWDRTHLAFTIVITYWRDRKTPHNKF